MSEILRISSCLNFGNNFMNQTYYVHNSQFSCQLPDVHFDNYDNHQEYNNWQMPEDHYYNIEHFIHTRLTNIQA